MSPQEIELRRQMAEAVTAARSLHEVAEAAGRDLTAEERSQYDQHLGEARSLEQRASRARDLGNLTPADPANPDAPIIPGGPERRSLEHQDGHFRAAVAAFLESDELAGARARGYKGGFQIPGLSGTTLGELRALIDNTVGSGGALQNPQRMTRIPIQLPDTRLNLLDLIPHEQTTNNSVEWVSDTTTDVLGNTAVETAEGNNLKPESTETFAVVTDPVRTIPAWMDMTRQSLDDNPTLQGFLRGRLIYRALRRLNSQLINGDGTGVNLLGLLNRPNIMTYTPAAVEARALSIRRARTLGEQREQEYKVVVLNPLDMEKFDLTLTSGSGEFLTGPAVRGEAPATVWGMLPIWSNAIAAGTAMLLNPDECMLWDRMEPTVYLTDSDADKFRRNILTMLVDLRAALSLFVGPAVCKVTFNGNV